jgi:NAD(P)-dependent dehydrogenase (short-subunit alcohol dehydrogenase family)
MKMEKKEEKLQVTGEVALVTGSRRGIGLGIATALASGGFNVVLNGTSPPSESTDAVERVRSVGVRAIYVQADISVAAEREKLVKRVEEEFGRIDILVNNAGISPKVRLDLLEATEESFDHVLGVNLKGPYFLTQRVANWMIELKRKHTDSKPKIVSISSNSAYTVSLARGEYCVSKAGISMMTALYAIRLADHGIGVYEIRPGIIETDMTAVVKEKYDRLISEGLTPIRRWGTPEDVGRTVLAIAKDLLPYSTGEIINVDGGFHMRVL